jgi:hypothetical protein
MLLLKTENASMQTNAVDNNNVWITGLDMA